MTWHTSLQVPPLKFSLPFGSTFLVNVGCVIKEGSIESGLLVVYAHFVVPFNLVSSSLILFLIRFFLLRITLLCYLTFLSAPFCRNYSDESQDPVFSKVCSLDLSTVVSCCSGPKRPHDRVAISEMKTDFLQCLDNKVGFKGIVCDQVRPFLSYFLSLFLSIFLSFSLHFFSFLVFFVLFLSYLPFFPAFFLFTFFFIFVCSSLFFPVIFFHLFYFSLLSLSFSSFFTHHLFFLFPFFFFYPCGWFLLIPFPRISNSSGEAVNGSSHHLRWPGIRFASRFRRHRRHHIVHQYQVA